MSVVYLQPIYSEAYYPASISIPVLTKSALQVSLNLYSEQAYNKTRRDSIDYTDGQFREQYMGTDCYQTPMKTIRERSDSIPKENPPSPHRVNYNRNVLCKLSGIKPASCGKSNTSCLESMSFSSESTNPNAEKNNSDFDSMYDEKDYIEVQYKRPKKNFQSKQERKEFVESYTAKKKTEVTLFIIIWIVV